MSDPVSQPITVSVEEHYRPQELAKRLGVSCRTVARWIAAGRASHGKRGIWPVRYPAHCTLIPASSVIRFLGRHTI
jgi:hypothetical protein